MTSQDLVEPVRRDSASRLAGVDLARSVALYGMFVVHLGFAAWATRRPTRTGRRRSRA